MMKLKNIFVPIIGFCSLLLSLSSFSDEMWSPKLRLDQESDGTYTLTSKTKVPNTCYESAGTKDMSFTSGAVNIDLLFTRKEGMCHIEVTTITQKREGITLNDLNSQVHISAILDGKMIGEYIISK